MRTTCVHKSVVTRTARTAAPALTVTSSCTTDTPARPTRVSSASTCDFTCVVFMVQRRGQYVSRDQDIFGNNKILKVKRECPKNRISLGGKDYLVNRVILKRFLTIKAICSNFWLIW